MAKTKSVPAPKTRAKSSVLSPSHEKYVDARASGMKQTDAAIVAGMAPNASAISTLEKQPKISQALLQERAKNAYMLGLTREDVLQGFMDAIEQAKVMSDPMSQIAGWREIAKVCGFNAPEVKKIELSAKGKRVLDKLAALSDEELLQIAEADIIDGEFEEVRTSH